MKKRSKSATVFSWVLQILVAFMLGKAAVLKFSGAPGAVEMFTHIGMEPGGRILIGVLEMISALLLLLPYGTIYGAFLGLGIMIGAFIGHFTTIGVEGIQFPFLVLSCCLGILYLHRHENSIFRNMVDH